MDEEAFVMWSRTYNVQQNGSVMDRSAVRCIWSCLQQDGVIPTGVEILPNRRLLDSMLQSETRMPTPHYRQWLHHRITFDTATLVTYPEHTLHVHLQGDTLNSPLYTIIGPVITTDHRPRLATVHLCGAKSCAYLDVFRLLVTSIQQLIVGPPHKVRIRCPLLGIDKNDLSRMTPVEIVQAYDSFVHAANTVLRGVPGQWTFCLGGEWPSHHPLVQRLTGMWLALEEDIWALPKQTPGITDIVIGHWLTHSHIAADHYTTTYLHNVVFNPAMQQSKNWIIVK